MPRRTLKKVVEMTVEAKREYEGVKEAVVHDSIASLETKTNPFVFAVFAILTIGVWWAALNERFDLGILFDKAGLAGFFYPAVVVLAISYFTIYLGSKLIIKPVAHVEETDMFTPIRTYPKEYLRRLVAIGLSVIHTGIVFTVVISRQ